MPKLQADRLLQDGDNLYRKLNPSTWDPITLRVYPAAFRDQHDDLSFYVARFMRPQDVLGLFTKFPRLRKEHFGDTSPRTPQDLWDKGFGIAIISVQSIPKLGVKFKSSHGYEISKQGHVDVERGKEYDMDISLAAVALTYSEVFHA